MTTLELHNRPAGLTTERLKEIKKICACIPFIDGESGVAETMQAMRELIDAVHEQDRDLEICMAALDHLACQATIGPAILSNICEAGRNEIEHRRAFASEQRDRTAQWQRSLKDTTP